MPRWQCGEHLPRSYHQSAAAPLRDSDNDNTTMVTTAISRGRACAAPGTGGNALRALRVLILVGTPCPASSVPSVAWMRKVGGPELSSSAQKLDCWVGDPSPCPPPARTAEAVLPTFQLAGDSETRALPPRPLLPFAVTSPLPSHPRHTVPQGNAGKQISQQSS